MREQKLEIYLFFILLAAGLYLTFAIFSPYLYSLAVAGIFAVVFYPLYGKILNTLPKYPSIASLVTLIIVVILVLIPLVFFGIQISGEIKNLYNDAFASSGEVGLIPKLAEASNNVVKSLAPLGLNLDPVQSADIKEYAFGIVSWLKNHFGDIFSGIAKFFVNFLIFLISFYYFLRDGKKICKNIVFLSPFQDSRDYLILEKLNTAVHSIVKGSILVALIQGFVSGIGYFIFGLPSAMLWGGVTAVAALVPGVGTSLILIPSILYLLLTGSVVQAIGLAIWGGIAVGLVDNFLGPKFIERGVNIHPLLILLSALGGIAYFGPVGFLLGPITLSFLFAILEIYKTIIIKDEALGTRP